MDCCFPSQGGQPGITVLVTKETKTKAVGTFMVTSKKVIKTVYDFMRNADADEQSSRVMANLP